MAGQRSGTYLYRMFRFATTEDIPTIVDLLNSAYRGERSQRGWTTEAHLIAGDVRTDDANVLEVMHRPGSVFLTYLDDAGSIRGCVNLQQHDRGIYLGMFSVEPGLQGAGIGKKMLMAAEEHALGAGAPAIYMYVISVRDELIGWYKRYGYRDTGERVPFPEDGLSGRHLRPLEFMVLEKSLAGGA